MFSSEKSLYRAILEQYHETKCTDLYIERDPCKPGGGCHPELHGRDLVDGLGHLLLDDVEVQLPVAARQLHGLFRVQG